MTIAMMLGSFIVAALFFTFARGISVDGAWKYWRIRMFIASLIALGWGLYSLAAVVGIVSSIHILAHCAAGLGFAAVIPPPPQHLYE